MNPVQPVCVPFADGYITNQCSDVIRRSLTNITTTSAHESYNRIADTAKEKTGESKRICVWSV